MKPVQTQKINAVEVAAYIFVAIVVVVGWVLSLARPDTFAIYIVEDGFVEWLTVVGFAAGALVCFTRVVRLRRVRTLGFLVLTAMLGLAFTFIAGEEISWGQRIFDLETPQWLEERNTQQELNLHNMKIGEVKINKLVFSKVAAGVMFVYFILLMPFYGKPGVARWIDALAIPIPKLHHAAACLIMLVFTQLIVTANRHGELAEFGGSVLFTIIVAFPSNFPTFDPKRSTRN